MDMKKLFDDFKNHVDEMDDEAILDSIQKAIENSANDSEDMES